MANALNQDLTGQIVVLKPEAHRPEFRAPRQLLFRCEGGFGCAPFTIGTAIMGTYLVDGTRARVEGYAVERTITEAEAEAILRDPS